MPRPLATVQSQNGSRMQAFLLTSMYDVIESPHFRFSAQASGSGWPLSELLDAGISPTSNMPLDVKQSTRRPAHTLWDIMLLPLESRPSYRVFSLSAPTPTMSTTNGFTFTKLTGIVDVLGDIGDRRALLLLRELKETAKPFLSGHLGEAIEKIMRKTRQIGLQRMCGLERKQPREGSRLKY